MKRLLRVLIIAAIASTIVGLVYLKWRRRGPGPDWIPATEWQAPTVEPSSPDDEPAVEDPVDLREDALTDDDIVDLAETPDEGDAVDLPATTVPGAAMLDGTPLYDVTVEAAPETPPGDGVPEARREHEATPFYDESAELPAVDDAQEASETATPTRIESPISHWTIGHAEIRTEPATPSYDESATAPATEDSSPGETSNDVETPLYDESAELTATDDVAPPAGLEPATDEPATSFEAWAPDSTADEPVATIEPAAEVETPPYDDDATLPATDEAPAVEVPDDAGAPETAAEDAPVDESATDEVVRPGGLEPPTLLDQPVPDVAEPEATVEPAAEAGTPGEDTATEPDATLTRAFDELVSATPEAATELETPAVPVEPAGRTGAALSDVIEEALQDVRPEPVPASPTRDAESYLDEGNVYFNVGQYGLAIDRYTRAIEADPTLTAGHYNRANARTRAGDYDRALEDYDQALELTPDDADALNNRGMLHLYRASYDLALRDFNAALVVDPNDTTVMVNRGLAYLHGGDAAQALVDFQQAASRDPDDAAAHYGAGQAAATLGNRDDALNHLRRAMVLDPAYAREAAADAKLVSLQGDADFLRLLRDAGARG